MAMDSIMLVELDNDRGCCKIKKKFDVDDEQKGLVQGGVKR